MLTGARSPAEAEHDKLLADYERALEAYGAAVRAAKGSFAAKGSARFKLRTDAVNAAHAKCEDLHTHLGVARVSMSEPDLAPLGLDETEQRLYAEFHECVNELAVAEDKITHPRKSMLHADSVILHELVAAIRNRCVQIRVKIRDYKRDKAGTEEAREISN